MSMTLCQWSLSFFFFFLSLFEEPHLLLVSLFTLLVVRGQWWSPAFIIGTFLVNFGC